MRDEANRTRLRQIRWQRLSIRDVQSTREKLKPINIVISLIRSRKQKLLIKIPLTSKQSGIEDQTTSPIDKTLLDRLCDRINWAQEIIFVHLVSVFVLHKF